MSVSETDGVHNPRCEASGIRADLGAKLIQKPHVRQGDDGCCVQSKGLLQRGVEAGVLGHGGGR